MPDFLIVISLVNTGNNKHYKLIRIIKNISDSIMKEKNINTTRINLPNILQIISECNSAYLL